jgi:hypothetical protein
VGQEASVNLDVVLCNHAEAAENKLYLTGGGITMCLVQPQAPHIVSVSLGIVIHVPYQATNQGHTLNVALIDEDARAVAPFQLDGAPEAPPIELTVPFNIGRPPVIQVGDEQTIALAANFANLPLANVGLYQFVVSVDGSEICRRNFRVMAPPPGFGMMLPGAPLGQ